MNPCPFFLSLLTITGCLCSNHLTAGEWPRWRGTANTGHVEESAKVPSKFSSEPRVVWKRAVGDGLASPVVSQGRVFLMDGSAGREVLKVFSVDEGKELWQVDIDAAFSDSQGPTGPRCTPVVEGDRVYVVSCRGELQCREVGAGKLLWKVNYVQDFGATFIGEKGTAPGASRHGNNGSPWLQGERLYAMAGSTNGAAIGCLDKRTGKLIWKSQNDQAGYAPLVQASPGGKPHLIAFTAEGLLGVAPEDGTFYWKVPMKTAFARHVTTPVVHGDYVVVSSHQAGLFSIRVKGAGGNPTAETAWVQKETAMNFSSPVGVGGKLFGLGPARNLICLDIESGRLHWSKEGLFTTSADKAHASFLVMKKNILMLTDAGMIVLFEATAEGYKELSRAQVCGLNWCNPAYADGRLYVRDGVKKGGDLYSIELLP